MIIDHVRNREIYKGLEHDIIFALDYLATTNLVNISEGRHEITAHMYLMAMQYPTKAFRTDGWEAHRKYIDIQYVVDSKEKIAYAPIDALKIVKEYDAKKDYTNLEGKENLFLTLKPGMFAIFFPDDAHQPGLFSGPSDLGAQVKKIVIKVEMK